MINTRQQIQIPRDPLLPRLAEQMDGVRAEVGNLHGSINSLEGKTSQINVAVASLSADFERFVQQDSAHKELALAETRLVRVRQELETTFGHHAEIRRNAIGLMRASDLAIVRQDTLRTAGEESMLAAPHYWLGPALVAIANWIADKRDIAERALAEALNRNDARTSMLMALVCRRLGRYDAARAWLMRYFSLQDPFALDRDVVVLTDALASGVFGAASKGQSLESIDGWIAEIRNRVGVIENERNRWYDRFVAMTPIVPDADYPALARYGDDWMTVSEAVRAVRRNRRVDEYVDKIFAGEIVASPQLMARVDSLVDRLVGSFDDEELPLRKEARRLELVVEETGDRKASDARFGQEMDAFEGRVSFVTLLTNAAMGIGVGEVSRATQRLSFALSIPWVSEAFEDSVAQARAMSPGDIAFTVDGYKATSKDGTDEADLVAGANRFVGAREQGEVSAYGGMKFWWPLIGAVIALAWFKLGGMIVVGLAVLLVIVQIVFAVQRQTNIGRIRGRYNEERAAKESLVKRICAEIVDLREELKREDAYADTVRAKLEDIKPEQQFGTTLEAGRKVLA